MQNYRQQFKGKKITIMGLGLLGRGIGYTKFLAECGTDLIVTDLKSSALLKVSLDKLKKYKNIKYTLGKHKLEDFKNRDMIIKSAGVPIDSPYIAEAKKNNIPIEMDVSLFAKYAPGVIIIGVTGTRGKSMTTTLIYEILKQNSKFIKYFSTLLGEKSSSNLFEIKKPEIFLGGNLRGIATLPLLKKARAGDILVCELDSWQLQGFGEAQISPHISVFTSFMPDHMNYYHNNMNKYFVDKANIFKYQKNNDILIIRPGMKKYISKKDLKGKLIVINSQKIADWKFNVPGIHQRENMICAVEVAKQLGIPEAKIKKTITNFKNLEGRLQLLRTYKGINIYNDNNATTPEATISGLEALSSSARKVLAENFPSHKNKATKEQKKIVLISGGADKNLSLDNFVKAINKYCKTVILIPGTGTDKLVSNGKFLVAIKRTKDLKEAIKMALKNSKKGDIILFSPAFASFGMFNNEYERNDLFIKLIKKLQNNL